MADDSEDQFFKTKTREPSLIGERPPPMGMTTKIGIGAALVAALSGIMIWQGRTGVVAHVWVVNPTAAVMKVTVEGNTTDIDPAKVSDIRIPFSQQPADVEVERAGKKETFKVEPRDDRVAVSILDVAADTAYVVVDVSSHYAKGAPEKAKILHISTPAKVHNIPYPALKLLRPGAPLPAKDSWELNVFKTPSSEVEIFKVFRVDARRVLEREKLEASLTEALGSTNISDYENLRARTSTVPTNGLIPPAGS